MSEQDTKQNINAQAETEAENLNEETVETESNADTEQTTQESLELTAAKAELQAYQERFIRLQAEVDNMRKQSAKEVEKAHKFALEKFARELLAVVDSLEHALEAQKQFESNEIVEKFIQGTELTLNQLVQTLEKFAITAVNPMGEKFNPEFHQAMKQEVSETAEPNTIIMVMQKGYLLEGRLLRPALVVVSKAKPAE